MPPSSFIINSISGESNGLWNRDKYGCTFQQLISDWRDAWRVHTPTDPNFPFGFMQLASYSWHNPSLGFTMIRWYQTSEYGYVPNVNLQNVFMGTALDTYDKDSTIHPRNKQLPCKRLATAGLNIAYGLEEFPTNGPFPVVADYDQLSGGIQITLTYDQNFLWNSTETEGFYICKEADPVACNVIGGFWKKVFRINMFKIQQST